MDQEKKQAIALMRYSAIAPLITGLSDDYESLTAFFNNASVKGVIHPDGTIKHYAPGTIEKWYRNYKEELMNLFSQICFRNNTLTHFGYFITLRYE